MVIVNKSSARKLIYRINMNPLISIPLYSVYYLTAFYIISDKLNWSWLTVPRSIMLGTFTGLFSRYVLYGEGYNRKRRIKILIWIIIGVVLIGVAADLLIKRIT